MDALTGSRARLWFLAALAAANMIAAVLIFREDDFRTVHGWTTAWLMHASDIYGTRIWATDYPPNAIVLFSPMALLPYGVASWSWLVGAMALAALAPTLAARSISDDASREDLLLLTVTFLAWSGTRTLLQFSLVTLCLSLAAVRLADRRPALAGLLLGLAIAKPQVAFPFCLWTLMTGRWRVGLAATLTVGVLWGVYCLRAGATPVAVLTGYVAILGSIYTGRERLTGFSELKTLLPDHLVDTWGVAIAVALFATAAAAALVASARAGQVDGRRPSMDLLPATASAAVLLAIRHMSLAFVTLLPAAAFLLLDGDEETRARRRPFFWVLQAGLIVDLPTLQRRIELSGLAIPWLGPLLLHFDRLLISGCFVLLVLIQLRTRVTPTSSLARA